MRIAVVLAVLVACGGGPSDKGFCAKLNKLCDAEMSAKDIDECQSELPELKKVLGDEPYSSFMKCANEASSCPELAGCGFGSLAGLAETAIEDFEKGFGKMMKKKSSTTTTAKKSRRGEEALPEECKRADVVCDADEPFARRKCKDMIGNIKADSANKAKLVKCYEAAKNCFEFAKCTDDLWFELN